MAISPLVGLGWDRFIATKVVDAVQPESQVRSTLFVYRLLMHVPQERSLSAHCEGIRAEGLVNWNPQNTNGMRG